MNYLTGQRRYRATEHGLILQVGYCFWNADCIAWRCDWRDADVHDVMSFELVR